MKAIHILLGCALALTVTSCDSFLDVRPKAEKLESDLFSDETGFEDAIYGVYGMLPSASLYGMDLTWGIPEVLAQNLYSTNTNMVDLAKYNYSGNDNLRTEFSNIWTVAYMVIGYANNILEQLEDESESTLKRYNLYKGEMLGIRALLHFDLLRLFASTDQTKTGIPYVTKYSFKVTEFSTVAKDYEYLIADLLEAEQLLSEEENKIVYPHDNTQYYKFENYRETHMNVYAVRALLARVYWMKGDLAKAGLYAEKVINSGAFPLVDETEVQDYLAGYLSPKETIFGIYSNTYYDLVEPYLYENTTFYSFSPYDDNSGTTHLLPWDALYELDKVSSSQDFRKNHFERSSAKSSARFLKLVNYYKAENKTKPSTSETLIEGITVMHVSEMYLIAAEAYLNSDYAKALSYFNAEISSRGLTSLRDVTLTEDIIYNEYHKEMFGEGQTWYNMKRLNKDIVSNYESRTIPANDDIYVLPIPQDEYDYRE
jgi:hypothetical protein